MESFVYRDGLLHCEDIALDSLADKYGTPLYIYSRSHLVSRFSSLKAAFSRISPLICYSVKANSNRAVIRTFVELGAGLDIVSGGELYRALKAGASPDKIVFAGVGKTRDEIRYALEQDILFFTVESEPEAARISGVASQLGRIARIAFRVNPDIDANTHKYVTTGRKENKFGLDADRIMDAYATAAALPNIEIAGLHMHIGSQILTAEPFKAAVETAVSLSRQLLALYPSFSYVDIGGGLGIKYRPEEKPLSDAAYAAGIAPALSGLKVKVVLEPGRSLVGNAGVLLCRVQYVKQGRSKSFVVVDTAMNDLIRPPLYEAYHEVASVHETQGRMHGDVVGPVCESGDFMAQDRDLPAVREGDLLAIKSAGAYGFVMASNYNSRPKPAEVMVDGTEETLVRRRETLEEMLQAES